ncbi:RNA pseudouridylate synthase domain containing protein 2 [Entomortierella chlamydospora]|uniref:RNA pseudouridylate synthase domain containing protein 2 n=1 Tax=Entomortierella chlamydospora TaxID=101097 RepID=A0A9P6T3S3_9FUNG|nr:RNA pseudouridylate synthase domain containing protein 2 [Entomortierella chlamydospora]
MSPKVATPRRGRAPPIEMPRPEYYFEDGLRKVKPYNQTYLAHVKQRWVNRTVPKVFASEMPRRCTETMIVGIRGSIDAMKRGDVLVNDMVVSPEYILKGGESLRSINCHRHEPPVPDTPIRILEQTKDYIVFDKPHGITVHPNELNFFNTALEILRRDHDIPSYMHAINRLDAVTSGVVIFANVADPTVRERFQPPNADSDSGPDALVHKEYVCRVVGEFPDGPVIVKEPILQSAGKVSVDPSGKPAETRFERKWYDSKSNSSLVSCFLATGRQHQIRLHVAHLNHPIVNDILYNPDYRTERDLRNSTLTANGETRFYPTEIPPESQPYMPYYISSETPCHKCKEELESVNVPNPKSMKIWLRAIRYQGPDWKFEVDMPDWADPNVLD